MRLFLASYRFGTDPAALVSLAGAHTRTLLIANACDSWPPAARHSAAQMDLHSLRAIGLPAEELDLRRFSAARPALLAETLGRCGLVWVRGGNTFVLRAQLAQSGADSLLSKMIRDNKLAYGGYSAGACVAAPTLRGLQSLDDPAEVFPVCGIQPMWDGLGLIEHQIVPHYGSPLDTDGAATQLAEKYATAGIKHQTLTDDQVIIVNS